MQFIEKNSFNVRSAIYRLNKDGHGLEFILFPMIHVGSKEFYDEVSDRLAKCDLILAEGVDSKKANLLTRSYRIVKKIRRMDLVTQQEGMKVASFRGKLMNADMEGRAFDEQWSSLPLALKAQIFFLMPVYVIYLFLFGTRETIAENIAVEDLPSSNEVLLQDDDFDKLEALLLDERDRRLIRNIASLHEASGQDKKTLGIVFAAMHMRNVTSFLLHKLKYRIAKADWVTVFDL
ncbi:MAG TPA: hypothetical protein VMZ30_19680 [Pyrinomonadaceae bacterium]|nr:hypothetical protein [Pyrinomonadaceae bacterium]